MFEGFFTFSVDIASLETKFGKLNSVALVFF